MNSSNHRKQDNSNPQKGLRSGLSALFRFFDTPFQGLLGSNGSTSGPTERD
jgi:hypothetical protein